MTQKRQSLKCIAYELILIAKRMTVFLLIIIVISCNTMKTTRMVKNFKKETIVFC